MQVMDNPPPTQSPENETRVGCKAIATLVELIEEYCVAHTNPRDGYVGDPAYLGLHYQFCNYLRTFD